MRHGNYKKKKHKKIRAHRKSVQKEPIVKRCLLILDVKPLSIEFSDILFLHKLKGKERPFLEGWKKGGCIARLSLG